MFLKALNVDFFSFSFLEWTGGPCIISLGTLDATFFAYPKGFGFPIAIAKSKQNLTFFGAGAKIAFRREGQWWYSTGKQSFDKQTLFHAYLAS